MSVCEALSDARSWVRTGGGPLCLISLFAGGHVLLTDIPGVDKTTFVKAISSLDRGGLIAHPVHLGLATVVHHGDERLRLARDTL
jgi:hypothetical protein